MCTHDLKLFTGTFQDIIFTLHKHDLTIAEKENIFCYWICGIYFGKLFRECGEIMNRCEDRRKKIIFKNATIRDQLFMDESGRKIIIICYTFFIIFC